MLFQLSTILVCGALYSLELIFTPRPAHIGGFVMGLLTGTVLYPIISTTKVHRTVTWFFRLAAIPLAVILYVVLIRNFYTSDPYAGTTFRVFAINDLLNRFTACSGCRYLSCFPTSANNHCKGYVTPDSVHVIISISHI